jgi:hypothetical protein
MPGGSTGALFVREKDWEWHHQKYIHNLVLVFSLCA